jgi:hypothetical protein
MTTTKQTPTVFYSDTRRIKLSPIACPGCGRIQKANGVEILDNAEQHLICECGIEVFVVERRC